MLKELEVLNGDLSPQFDSLNTKYTIFMNNDDIVLKFDYKILEKDNVSIKGNYLINDYNEVVITVYNDKESMSYYLEVYKNNTTLVNKTYAELASLESQVESEVSNYVVPSIASICFIIILFTFALLFRKKNKNTK